MILHALVVFAAGAAVMMLEILASRWLAPVFGFTLTTWASLISVTLLAGSIGAWVGGSMSARGRRVVTPLSIAATAIAIDGLAAPFAVGLVFPLPERVGLAIACLFLIVPAVVALGAILPMVTAAACAASTNHADNASRDAVAASHDADAASHDTDATSHDADAASGGAVDDVGSGIGPRIGILVAASTAGGLVGTLASAIVLVPTIGLRASAISLAVALAALAALTSRSLPQRSVALLGIVALGIITTALPAPPTDAHVVRETPYGRLELRSTLGGYSLHVNGINQATGPIGMADRGTLLERGQYVELLPYLRPAGKSLLQVGLGGGLVPNVFRRHGIDVDAIEINADLVDVVREHIGYDGPVTIADGRRAIRASDRTFDFIILDVFQGEVLPAHLMTSQAFAEAKRRLTQDGVLALHLIGIPRHVVTASVARTLSDVFSELLCLHGGTDDSLQDLFLFASDSPLRVPPHPALVDAGWVGNEAFRPEHPDAVVLTDDRNPLERWNEPLARALRRASLQ